MAITRAYAFLMILALTLHNPEHVLDINDGNAPVNLNRIAHYFSHKPN